MSILQKTHVDLASELEAQRLRSHHSRGDLVAGAGISYQSLQKILEGRSDFKVSNLLAIADVLGLEVALVPRGIGSSLPGNVKASGEFDHDGIGAPSVVTSALARLKPLRPASKTALR